MKQVFTPSLVSGLCYKDCNGAFRSGSKYPESNARGPGIWSIETLAFVVHALSGDRPVKAKKAK